MFSGVLPQSLAHDPVRIDRLPGGRGLRQGPDLFHAVDPTRTVRATIDPQKAGRVQPDPRAGRLPGNRGLL
ncbi:MAG: hypothetical protein ABS73_12775 [Paracoccus sp. SCN 68-21]|nr:MAG: hypothetical protein ABS73_12775 [Paracoccus sp. SCN 68-21]